MNIVQLLVLSLALTLITACGGGGTSDTQEQKPESKQIPEPHPAVDQDTPETTDITLIGLSPVISSDLAGIWIGQTAYTETQERSHYSNIYKGTRTYILQIQNSGTGYYDVRNCWGNKKRASIQEDQSKIRFLDRNLNISNLNVMTGKTNFAVNGDKDSGNEDWTWIKVSNSTSDLGKIVTEIDLEYSFYKDPETTTHNLKSICHDISTFTEGNASPLPSESFYFGLKDNQNLSHTTFKYEPKPVTHIYIGPLSEHYNNESENDETISTTISNSSLPTFKAAYVISGRNFDDPTTPHNTDSLGPYTISMNINVILPGL